MEHAQPQDAEHRLPHQPVLPDAVVGWLQPASGKVMVDCTVGSGGHSVALLPRLMPDGRLIALDHDEQSIESAKRRLAEFSPQVSFVQERFSRLPEALARLGLARVDGIVADLGISSMHLEDPGRGFSFTREGPLDMRMDRRQPTTAAALIQRLSEEELAYVLAEYGQERWARRIAKRVVAARRSQPITTTSQLARIVADALPGRGKIHPATRTFQALRIAVNEELSELDALLTTLPSCLAPGGRAVLISFHSLEDRRVKQAFRQGAVEGIYRLLTKKPMTPSEEERARNPRSRSAKLRVVERCAS
ncbi:MAG: 16S rRNA (cytosine(1402)-N(4))-methyltransferase RsmH [Candidatus Omnitrophica bacterium]|nr:16S rRNA (cytosine(1402)-N(4))-methyltransferase RsmH [Candidatus Omnitrophota bacterium]